MKYLYIIFFAILPLFAAGQSSGRTGGAVQGNVYDEKTREAIPSATIKVICVGDSTNVKAVATDMNGKFRMALVYGEYMLEVSFIGYKTFLQNFKISAKEPVFTINEILLEENSIELGAAIVEAKVPDIVVKGDTIEYNASAYSSQESDMLQDMIRNIPGVEIDANGNITANGKPVKKILVDGKEFFGNDIAMALANLPANMIKSLQLYKEESDEAKITGFKDKNPDQVLNLVVKEELKQSIFGDVKAGYGSDDKYANKILVNYMRNDNQLSVVGDLNNVSDNDYSMSMGSGIDKNKNIGANTYLQVSEKLKIGGNIRYSNNENEIENKTNTQMFLTGGDRFSKDESSSVNKQNNTNFGMNLQWKPDSLTTIYARSSLSFNNTDNLNTSGTISYVREDSITTGNTINQSKGDGYSINNFLTVGRKLNNKGRTISLTLNHSLRRDDSRGSNLSQTNYVDSVAVIDQRSTTNNRTNSYRIGLSYVEPLGKDYRLQLAYSIHNSHSDRERDVRRKDPLGDYSIVDTAYTRDTRNDFINQSINLNFQANKEKYNYTIGLSIDPSSSKSKISLGDSIIDNPKQTVVNFSPSLNFTYNPNQHSTFDFSYNGSTDQPGLSQLSADTVIINALNKYYGNPNLKPSYNNNVNMYYQKSNYETNRFLMLSAGFNYTFNSIAGYTLIDNQGNRESTYRNVNGNMSANLNFVYDTPLKNKKFTVNNSTYTNYSKNVGFTNGEKAITHNIVLGEQISGRFKTEKFETRLKAGITYNMARNNLTKAQDRNTTNYSLHHFALVKLPFDFSIQSSISYSYYSGYGSDFKNSEVLWNASVSKQFLKKKKGTLKLQLYDILDDRNNLTRWVNSNSLTDSRTNTVNQYFLVSFSYKFNIIKGKKKEADTEEIYEGGYYY